MQIHRLAPHPAYPPVQVHSIEARITGRDANWFRLRWRIEGTGALVVPAFAGKGRADGLWQTTCFELFLKPTGGEAYCEFNLSPSERWNVYDFETTREGMQERPLSHEPACTMRLGSAFAIFDAAIPARAIPQEDCAMGLSAVIEEEGGKKSYWALVHSDSDRPDFHAPACFAAQLEAPREP